MNSYTSLLPGNKRAARALLEELGVRVFSKNTRFFLAEEQVECGGLPRRTEGWLVQGRAVEEFVQFELEPKILGEANWATKKYIRPEMFEPTSAWMRAERAFFSDRW